jgi:hypothetical protein
MATIKPDYLTQKLAPELRLQIYEHVLSFSKPLKHVRNLTPFIKKPPYISRMEAVLFDHHYERLKPDNIPSYPTTGKHEIDIDIMFTCKRIYTETVSFFYDHNTIQLPARCLEMVKRAKRFTGDLSMARSIQYDDFKLDSILLEDLQRHIPKLRTISCNTDIMHHNSDGPIIMGLAHQFLRSRWIKSLHFVDVGHFIATTVRGGRICVRSHKLADLWCAHSLPASRQALFDDLRRANRKPSLTLRILKAQFLRFECRQKPSTFLHSLSVLRFVFQRQLAPFFAASTEDSAEFWTWYVEMLDDRGLKMQVATGLDARGYAPGTLGLWFL